MVNFLSSSEKKKLHIMSVVYLNIMTRTNTTFIQCCPTDEIRKILDEASEKVDIILSSYFDMLEAKFIFTLGVDGNFRQIFFLAIDL